MQFHFQTIDHLLTESPAMERSAMRDDACLVTTLQYPGVKHASAKGRLLQATGVEFESLM